MRSIFVFACLGLAGCALATHGNPDFGNPDGGSGNPGFGNDGGSGNGGSGTPVIYAHSDTELFTFDPTTKQLVDVGAFNDGSGSTPTITDLAVNANGDVWVNSETAIYRAALPNGTGPVALTLVSKITVGSSQSFYALGFAPAGVLGSNETLVAGDNHGVLYAIENSGQTTELGSFGTNSSGDTYELSGDVLFYEQNGTVRGLATVRSCTKSGSCTSTNDILAEVDVAAMSNAYKSHSPAATLKKQFLGNGTGFGRLFGIGAWDDSVYAFSRASGSTPAELIAIDGSGNGTVVQSFGSISAGWSGAGVTTKAPVTVLAPN
jgi:hypothetical protein